MRARAPNPSSQDGPPMSPQATPNRRVIRAVASGMNQSPVVVASQMGTPSGQVRAVNPGVRFSRETPPRGHMVFTRNLAHPAARVPIPQGSAFARPQPKQVPQGHQQQHQRPQNPQQQQQSQQQQHQHQQPQQQLQQQQQQQLQQQQQQQQQQVHQQQQRQTPQDGHQSRHQHAQPMPQPRQRMPQHHAQMPLLLNDQSNRNHQHWLHQQQLVRQNNLPQLDLRVSQYSVPASSVRTASTQHQGTPATSQYSSVPASLASTPRTNGTPMHPSQAAAAVAWASANPAQPMPPAYDASHGWQQQQQHYYNLSQRSMEYSPRQGTPQHYMHPNMSQFPYVAWSDTTAATPATPVSRKRAATSYGTGYLPPKPSNEEASFVMQSGHSINLTSHQMVAPISQQYRSAASTPNYHQKSSTLERPRKTAVRRPLPNPAQDAEMEPVESEAEEDNGELVISEAIVDAILKHPESKKKSFDKEALKKLSSSVELMMESYIEDIFAKAETRFERETSDEAVEEAGQFDFLMKYYAAQDRKARHEANPAEAEVESNNAIAPTPDEASLAAIGSVQPKTNEAPAPQSDEPIPSVPQVTYKDVDEVIYDDPILHNTPLAFYACYVRPNDVYEEIKRFEEETVDLFTKKDGAQAPS